MGPDPVGKKKSRLHNVHILSLSQDVFYFEFRNKSLQKPFLNFTLDKTHKSQKKSDEVPTVETKTFFLITRKTRGTLNKKLVSVFIVFCIYS